jgi:predicted esterase
MRTTLVALHGITLNGTHMRTGLGELVARFPRDLELVCPDAPHETAPATVDRIYAFSRATRLAPPHRSWWNASDEGRIYDGWDLTRDSLREVVAAHPRVGMLGFSQGAILAAALAALSEHGAFPPLAFVILVAGRTPRADAIVPFLERPISIPSLHIWGTADAFAAASAPALVEHFDERTREQITWPGPHLIPTRGPAADGMLSFIERHCTRAEPASGIGT